MLTVPSHLRLPRSSTSHVDGVPCVAATSSGALLDEHILWFSCGIFVYDFKSGSVACWLIIASTSYYVRGVYAGFHHCGYFFWCFCQSSNDVHISSVRQNRTPSLLYPTFTYFFSKIFSLILSFLAFLCFLLDSFFLNVIFL